MTTTELVPYDPAFARFQLTGLPILSRPLYDSEWAEAFDAWAESRDHDVNWRFYDPSVVDLDDLDGLDYYDQRRLREPDAEDDAAFLDAFELEHVAQTGRAPRSRWYADARQRQRIRARQARQAKLTRDWAKAVGTPVFTMGDHDDSLVSGTEEFSDFHLPSATLRVKTWVGKSGRRIPLASCFDKDGRFLPAADVVRSRASAERYRDTSVAETAIFHPVKGDGLTLDEMLSDMARFERQSPDEWEPLDTPSLDEHYVKPDAARRKIRAARKVVELAELKARAVEICRFPWNDDQADRNPARARGWVRRSRLLEWGSDTWQVILTRKRYAHGESFTNHWTVFVRTHTGSETVRRAGRPDLQVWTWEPHYYLSFADEEQASQWLERLESAFLRERHGDLDQERWPNDLVNDRSVAAAQAAAEWKLWHARNRDGWQRINLDGRSAPGALTFDPEQAQTWDPAKLAERLDGEYARYEEAQ